MDVIPRIAPICLATLTFAAACGGPDPLIGTWNLRRVNTEAYPAHEEYEGCALNVSVTMEIEDDLDGEMLSQYQYTGDCDYESSVYAELLEAEPDGDDEYEIRLYDQEGDLTLYACDIHGSKLECRVGGEMHVFERS